ncbi:hypothetical protein KIW84_072141 [Lathyrus oleraceus]|uniref:ATP synthase subunit 9, mitochondrial n=1 Tax=Pisum sativum TaxID=3888 RepID=A0A9D4VMI1_PEA|nr:hypothetical protein KIW84_MT0019 [Pisum sativum]KAI5385426.1 hypothetical protein KIW84_072141 [Pisum sativum]
MLEGAKSIGAGAATIASAGAAVGIGNVFSSLIHSVARNPSLAKQLFGYAILGFALTEAIALVSLPIELQRFWSGSRSLIKSDPFFSKVPVGFDLPTDPRVRNGKRRISRTGSRNRSSYIISILLFNGKLSNDKFSSAGKQSFTDMGAYSAVAGLVSISLMILKKEWIERKAPGFLSLGVNIGMGAV